MTEEEILWNDILINFANFTNIAMLIPILFAIWKRAYWTTPLKIIFFYCLIGLGLNCFEQLLIWLIDNYTDFFLPYLEYWEIENTFFLLILYYLNDFILLGLFYSKIFPIKPFNEYIKFMGLLLSFIVLINYCLFEGYKSFGILNMTLNGLFVIVLPFVYLWHSQRETLRISLKKNPYFWISLSLLIVNLLSLFLYFSGDYIYETNFVLYSQLFLVKNIFVIFGQILIAIGFNYSYYSRFLQTENI